MNETSNKTVKDLKEVQGHKILLEIDPAGCKPIDWMADNKTYLEKLIQDNGVVLLRGLKLMGSKQFGMLLEKLFDEKLINYSYRSTPRTELKGNVYTATEYHAEETIPQHNENAYSNKWPMRIGFLCMLPSATGGETPLADSRKVYQAIDSNIRAEFEHKKIMYVRNYSDIDLPWSEVFQTEDRSVVEDYCNSNQIEFEWLGKNGLRTSQVNNAVERHPVTGELVWFNQAHLFHVSNLHPDLRESLLSVVGEKNLPRNSYFGDGSSIEVDKLEHIRQVYEDLQFSFPWQKNDLVLLDNMLYTHGRKPYSGERKILVGMACPYASA